ncbi:hypothetical protein ACHAW5_003119 [Stephanodiscus triporus]|uniref:Uncharacterized protein n=1 Tax=Stephanodiscus triporus TaxID=2934178 RepID=A0ABD3QJ55_9STRA
MNNPLHDTFSMESSPRRRSFDVSDKSRQGRDTESSLFVSWSHPVVPSASEESQQEQRPFPSVELVLDEDSDFPRLAMPTSDGGTPMHSSTAGSLFSKSNSIQHDINHSNAISVPGVTSSDLSRGGQACQPTPAPQLRIRPITLIKKPKMPSPLAWRGAAERAYLQGQLRAESLRRRKQELHNAERKLLENANDVMMPKDDFNDENDASDIQIQTMIENFMFGFADLGHDPNNAGRNHHHNTLPPKTNNNPQDPISLSSSPPTILKKSFRRTVSEVLADSGIDENGNLLFFPSGVPLLDEEDEIDPRDAVEGALVVDNCSTDSVHGIHGLAGGDAQSPDVFDSGLASEESSTTGDNSPLVAADVIWQLGTCGDVDFVMPNPLSKKVTLRPKMNAPNNKNATNGPRFTPIDGCIAEGNSSCSTQSVSACDAERCMDGNSSVSHECECTFPFTSLDELHPVGGKILNTSESFKQLSFDDNVGGGEIFNASKSFKQLSFLRLDGGDSGKVQFPFSSPADRSFREDPPTLSAGEFSLKESPLETNYCTPDNSEQHRHFRKQVGARMPKLPELENMNHASEEGMLLGGEATRADDDEPQFEMALEAKFDHRLPDNNEHNQRALKQVGWMRQLPKLMSNESSTFQSGIVMKASLSEFNFRTPDHSESRCTRKQVGWMMPQSQEHMPRLTDGSDEFILHSTAGETKVFFPEELSNLTSLSESNYRTPDNSFHDRHTARVGHLDQMPKLPELGPPITTMNQFWSDFSEENSSLKHQDAVKTPC